MIIGIAEVKGMRQNLRAKYAQKYKLYFIVVTKARSQVKNKSY